MTLPGPLDRATLERLLEPDERNALVLYGQCREVHEVAHKMKLTQGEVAALLDRVRGKLRAAAIRAETAVRERRPLPPPSPPPARPSPRRIVREAPVRSSGKCVTVPQHVTRPPERRAVMEASSTPSPEPHGNEGMVPADGGAVSRADAPQHPHVAAQAEGFTQRIEREAHTEAKKVLAELARLRFDAHQVVHVLNALKLPVPEELRAFVEGGVVLAAETPAEAPPAPSPAPEPAETGESLPPAPAAAETGAEAPKPPGRTSATEQARDQAQASILATLRTEGPLPLGEVVKKVGLSQVVVSRHLKTMLEDGRVDRQGRAGSRNSRWLAAAAPEDEPIDDAHLRAVRDFVCSQREPFSPAQAAEATSVAEDVVRIALAHLIRREVITYVGLDDLELYEYVPPTDAGSAAKLDAKRHKDAAKSNGTTSGEVAGTGGGPRSNNKATNAILTAAEKAGAVVERTGSGHFRIRNPKNGRAVIVGSTESSSKDNKTKKRLAGIGIAV